MTFFRAEKKEEGVILKRKKEGRKFTFVIVLASLSAKLACPENDF